MTTLGPGKGTVRDALVEALQRAALYNSNDQTAPAAVLWADPNGEWSGVASELASTLQILTLGDYTPEQLTGPAIWLRCVVDGTVPGLARAKGTPIVYLPGVDSNAFRSAANVPTELEPLVELRHRGALFRHPNGRDWTPRAFLATTAGVTIREDRETTDALRAALEALLESPVATLKGKGTLDASFFHGLLTSDAVRELLLWMNTDPTELDTWKADKSRWRSFRDLVKSTYGIDPERDGALTAAEKLLAASSSTNDPWNGVWERYREAPLRYKRLPDLLRSASPQQGGLFTANDRSPTVNEAAELALRQALDSLAELPVSEAREALQGLEAAHGERRSWVWAELGAAPLATALQHIAALLEHTGEPLGAGTPAEIAARYATSGWRADRAALRTLAATNDTAPFKAIATAVTAVYRPWLEDAALAFQAAVKAHGLPRFPDLVTPKPGRCVLFTDGLRFDLANDLADSFRAEGAEVTLEHTLGAVPGVTASAKPATSPARNAFAPGPEFQVTFGGTAVDANVLRRAIAEEGIQVLEGDAVGDPSGPAWTEYGNIDSIGHADGVRLAHRVETELRAVASRVSDLLAAGWSEVVVVTDHGWLLLPGGLPKVTLPLHLTQARKGRCARVKEGAGIEYQTAPWAFDTAVDIAVAPGIAVFVNSAEYEHGGLSPQESVLPVLRVKSAPSQAAGAVTWDSVAWTGLRVRVEVAGAPAGATIDLRTKPADAATSIVSEPRPVYEDGKASLLVADEDREGSAAILVLLDPAGRVVSQLPTAVGGG